MVLICSGVKFSRFLMKIIKLVIFERTVLGDNYLKKCSSGSVDHVKSIKILISPIENLDFANELLVSIEKSNLRSKLLDLSFSEKFKTSSPPTPYYSSGFNLEPPA